VKSVCSWIKEVRAAHLGRCTGLSAQVQLTPIMFTPHPPQAHAHPPFLNILSVAAHKVHLTLGIPPTNAPTQSTQTHRNACSYTHQNARMRARAHTPALMGESPSSGASPLMAWLVLTGSHFSTISFSLPGQCAQQVGAQLRAENATQTACTGLCS